MPKDDELLDYGRALDSGSVPTVGQGGKLANRDTDSDKHHRPPPHGRSHATIT